MPGNHVHLARIPLPGGAHELGLEVVDSLVERGDPFAQILIEPLPLSHVIEEATEGTGKVIFIRAVGHQNAVLVERHYVARVIRVPQDRSPLITFLDQFPVGGKGAQRTLQ